jgi:hypothetical protein
VADFVRSFLDGDLIPAVIMWWSNLNGTVYVIDGAHRLSAPMAWVHDDYGDGKISQEFWGHAIPEGQKRLAKATKNLIEQQIGPYHRLKYIAQHPDQAPDQTTLLRARNIATFKIDLQWVEGNAATAEKSFFKINGNASPIDATELAIIKARRKPNALATRALMKAGTGHKYWSDFPPQTQSKIESLSREIYDGLFRPILETPIKTLDLPIAGQAYSANAFKMIFDLVNMVNGVTPAMWEDKQKRQKNAAQRLEDDADGQATVAYLSRVKRAASLISGKEARSTRTSSGRVLLRGYLPLSAGRALGYGEVHSGHRKPQATERLYQGEARIRGIPDLTQAFRERAGTRLRRPDTLA